MCVGVDMWFVIYFLEMKKGCLKVFCVGCEVVLFGELGVVVIECWINC